MPKSVQNWDADRVYSLDSRICCSLGAPEVYSKHDQIRELPDVRVKGNKRLEMKDLTSTPSKYKDDTNQKKLEYLWGDSCKRLTPKQRQLVVEILSNLKKSSRPQLG